jgi:hypothetical protein
MNVEPSCGVGLDHLFPIQHYPDSFALVPRLLVIGYPAAIIGAVSEVRVNPVKRTAFRPVTHVGIKSLKACPRLTVTNADATISVIVDRLGIVAALLHGPPRTVSAKEVTVPCRTMRD